MSQQSPLSCRRSPVAKRGRTGCTWFYRASSAVKTKAFDIGGERVLDLLASGRQTVIPPSLHPATGREYEWIGDPLELFTPESLPLAPDDIAERVAEALKPFGYEPEAVSDRVSVSSGDGWWRETNEAALADLDRWVPALGIGRENVRRKTDGGYRMKAVWRNGDAFNVGITPKGITDWADGAGKGYSAPGLVMEIKGWDFSTAESWLRKQLGLHDPVLCQFIFRRENSNIWSAPVVLERVRPEDPMMVAAAEMARAEAGDEAWAAHSEAALRCAGSGLQFARDHGLDSSEALVAAWMMQQVRAEQRRIEIEAKRQAKADPEAEQPRWEEPKQEQPEAAEPKGDEAEPDDKAVWKPKPWAWQDPKTLPRLESLYGGHYYRGEVVSTVAPGGVGKSMHSIVEALAMITGKPLLGEPSRGGLRVMLCNYEDGDLVLRHRVTAAMLHYRIKPEEIAGRLFVESMDSDLMCFAKVKRDGVEIIKPSVDALVDAIRDNGIDVVIIDPWVSVHQVDGNLSHLVQPIVTVVQDHRPGDRHGN